MSDDLMKRAREAWKTGDDWEAMVLLRPTANRIEELEAKLSKSEALLAKAVGDLASVMSQYDRFREDEYAVGLAPLDDAIETARTTLAELSSVSCANLKGETDEC